MYKFCLLFQVRFILVHVLVRSFKYGGYLLIPPVPGGSGCDHNLSICFVLPVDLLNLFHYFIEILIILSVNNNYKLIASESEYRTVSEGLANDLTAILDVFITGLMPLCIIYEFQIVQIKYSNGKTINNN